VERAKKFRVTTPILIKTLMRVIWTDYFTACTWIELHGDYR